MMAGIAIDRHVVCMEHDFNGMTLEYFWNFLLNEYIPAYKDELSNNEILQIHEGIKKKKTHILIYKEGKLSHIFSYATPFITFSNGPKYEFNGM